MWKLKNSDEYCVFAPSRKVAVKKFEKDLGIIVTEKMIKFERF